MYRAVSPADGRSAVRAGGAGEGPGEASGYFSVVPGEGWIAARADRHPRIAMRAVAEAFGYVRWAWHPEWKAPQVFDLFRPDRTYRGTVELPFDYVPMSVSGDRLYGVHSDELGVERVVVFEVEEK